MLQDYFNLKKRNIDIKEAGRITYHRNAFLFFSFLLFLFCIFLGYFISSFSNIETEQLKIIFNVLNNHNVQELYYKYNDNYTTIKEISSYFENISSYKDIDSYLFQYFSIENFNSIEKEHFFSLAEKKLKLAYEFLFSTIFMLIAYLLFLLKNNSIFKLSFDSSITNSIIILPFFLILSLVSLLPFIFLYNSDIDSSSVHNQFLDSLIALCLLILIVSFVVSLFSLFFLKKNKKISISSKVIDEYYKNEKKINNIEDEYVSNKKIDEIIKESQELNIDSNLNDRNIFLNLLGKKKAHQNTFEKLKGSILND